MEKAKYIMFEAKLERSLCLEAVKIAIYLVNRTETFVLPKNTTSADFGYTKRPNLI